LPALPTGSVTYLFSDIEGSTRLARELGPDAWADLLALHDQLVDRVVADARGVVVKHEGDGAFAVFRDASDAVDAAVALASRLSAATWATNARVRVRVGLHTGDGRLASGGRDYVGLDVHYAARLAAAANGGQILLSDTTRSRLGNDLRPGSSIVSVGPRRLKDFDEPRPIHRLVVANSADDPRPLRALGGFDLPELPTTFVGREDERAAVTALVTETRIVTLTGPGGTGKTRLALSVAMNLEATYPEGVVFVPLAPIRDAGLIASAIADAAAVPEDATRPPIDSLRDALRDRHLLLVLDNLEQLLPAAAATVAELVRGLPGCRFLLSSREPLRIAGEQEYRVPPLASADGVALFEERARLVGRALEPDGPDREAIVAIVERVDGLPLAIELAAARARLFPPREILERLERSFDILSSGARDLPERQQTLRATIGWSVDLLSPAEQRLFRRLSVFVGTWAPEAAESVVDPDRSLGPDLLDAIASLADKSLLRTAVSADGRTRFGWHVFVRDFALEMLVASGEQAEYQQRHAESFRDLAVRMGTRLTAARSAANLAQLDDAIHDLRSAIDWSLETGRVEIGLEIVGSAWRWWQLRSHLAEGRDLARQLLSHPAAARDSIARVDGLAAAGGLAYWSSDRAATRAAYEERLALAQRLGDRRRLAEAHYDLGFVGMVEQDVDLLRSEEERALALFEELGDDAGIVKARQALVLARFVAQDYAGARELEERNLVDFERTQSWYRISDSKMLLAAIKWRSGDPDGALASARSAIEILPDPVGGSTIAALAVIALVEADTGDVELAARLTGAIRASQAATGETLAPVTVLHLPDPEQVVRERLGDERAAGLLAEGAELGLPEATRLALGKEATVSRAGAATS
jgi:predicted ATPase/class 3 adenylate cyclase